MGSLLTFSQLSGDRTGFASNSCRSRRSPGPTQRLTTLSSDVLCAKDPTTSGYFLQLHSDMDRGDGSIKYILSGEGAGVVFTIDDTTGDIHAIQRLDREERSQYTLRAQALDRRTGRPMEPESEFIIKIQDINDNEPKFLDGPYVASVPEMSPVGKNDILNTILMFGKLIGMQSVQIWGLVPAP